MTSTGNSLRIGFDIRGAQQESSVGRGIGRYIFDLIDGLSRFDSRHEFLLLVQPDLPVSDRFQSLPPSCRVVGVPTRHLGHLERLGIRRDVDKIKAVWHVRCRANQRQNASALAQVARNERLDLLHLTSNIEQTYFMHGAYPCPVVKTFYDATPLVMRDKYLGEWPHQVNTVYLRQMELVRQAACLVAISQSAADDAKRYLHVPADRVRVIYPAIPESFKPVTDEARARKCRELYGIHNPFFINCSGAGQNKNRDGAIRAFARFAAGHPRGRDFQFVLVGPRGGDESLLRNVAHEEGLADEQFVITGFVPDDDLVTLFSGAIALVAPSFYEGFGLPPAQALQVGTPAIVSNRGALPEVVGDAGLIVDPEDIPAIASAMSRLAGDPELCRTLGMRGRAHVAQFTSDRQSQEHLAVYREVVDARRKRRS